MPAQPCSRFFQHPAFAWKNKILEKKGDRSLCSEKKGQKKESATLDFRRLIVRYKRGISKDKSQRKNVQSQGLIP
jgi:hypothetical protein